MVKLAVTIVVLVVRVQAHVRPSRPQVVNPEGSAAHGAVQSPHHAGRAIKLIERPYEGIFLEGGAPTRMEIVIW